MTESQPSDDRLDQIIADYLSAEKSGNAPDRDQLLANHPDLAHELKAFFADHDRMHVLAEQPVAADAPTIPPKRHDADAATLPPAEASDATPAPGTTVRYFGDYELIEEIARGGVGFVYKGADEGETHVGAAVANSARNVLQRQIAEIWQSAVPIGPPILAAVSEASAVAESH